MSFDQIPGRKAARGLLAAMLGIALIVPSAHANGDSIWAECAAGNGVGTNHSQKDYQDALTNPPADGNEYSDCLDQIRAAQLRAATGGKKNDTTTSAGTGVSGGGTGGTGSTGGGAPAPAVAAGDLAQALTDKGLDPGAGGAAAAAAPAPAPVVVDGKSIDLDNSRLPSLGGALSLPLPLAASAVVVMLSAALPVARYLVARFGGPQTGTTPAS